MKNAEMVLSQDDETICFRCSQDRDASVSLLLGLHIHQHLSRIRFPRRRVWKRALLVTTIVCAGSFCILRVISNGQESAPLPQPCRCPGEEMTNTAWASPALSYQENEGVYRFSQLNCSAMDRMFNAYLERSRRKIIHQLTHPKQKGHAKRIRDYEAATGHVRNTTSLQEVLRKLKQYPPKMFTDQTPPWDANPLLGKLLRPKGSGVFGGRNFKTCACVSSSGLLAGRKLGAFIDSHDAVLRMNIAPTIGFQEDVGSKTTIRIINNEMLRWMNEPLVFPQFRAWEFPDTLNATLVAWESCSKRGPLTNCLENPELENVTKSGGESMQPMFAWLRQNQDREFHFLHSDWPWQILDILKWHSPGIVSEAVPSTGFLGFAFMMHFCETVRVFEMIPSMDYSFKDKELRYYFDNNAYESFVNYVDNFHPKGAEILLLLALNVGPLQEVFGDGYATIPGLVNHQQQQQLDEQLAERTTEPSMASTISAGSS